MATASSTAFGTSTSLFGNALAGTPAFGTSSAATQPAATGFSVGAAKLATTINKPGFSFGNTSQAPASHYWFWPSFFWSETISVCERILGRNTFISTVRVWLSICYSYYDKFKFVWF